MLIGNLTEVSLISGLTTTRGIEVTSYLLPVITCQHEFSVFGQKNWENLVLLVYFPYKKDLNALCLANMQMLIGKSAEVSRVWGLTTTHGIEVTSCYL